MAELVFKYGTMGSGKSLHLLSTAKQLKSRGIKYMLLKSVFDTRDSGVIKSRFQIEEPCITLEYNGSIYPYIDNKDIKFILVDEAQFLNTFQVDELAYLVDKYNINVICYGLRTDYLNHLFEGSKRLFEIADRIEELSSYCECGNKNITNARLKDDNNTIETEETEQIQVGGDESYKSMCRKCYNKLYNKSLKFSELVNE